MLKRIAFAAVLAAGSAAAAGEPPFGTLMLKGGRVEPVSLVVIETSNEHVNFCFAHRFDDGSIYLSHSKGIHTVTEYGCRDFSTDNGATWHRTPVNFRGFNAYTTRDGVKANIGAWDDLATARHTIGRTLLAPDGKSTTVEKAEIEMPYETTFRLHRDILRTRDGRLLLPGYGFKKGAPKRHAFLIESTDDGKSWHYLSTMLDAENLTTREGPSEAAVTELANGDLLAVARIDSQAPLHQMRSTDGGKSWTREGKISPFCVAPSMRVLKNGTLVIITGRPELYLLIDFTGTGKHYQQTKIYAGSGSSYASILETAPNELLVLYDQSDFGSWRNQAMFSQISAMKLRIVKDDSVKKEIAKGWHGRYLPQNAQPFGPFSNRFYDPAGRDGAEATWQIVGIAERPNPVLRLSNRGVTGTAKFANYRILLPRDAKEFTAMVDFRLEDPAEKKSQFLCQIALPNATGCGSCYGEFGFAVDGIRYCDGSDKNQCVFPIDIGVTKFHRAVMSADLESDTFSLEFDGKKLFTGKLLTHEAIVPSFQFGDGSSTVFGGVDVAEAAWRFAKSAE